MIDCTLKLPLIPHSVGFWDIIFIVSNIFPTNDSLSVTSDAEKCPSYPVRLRVVVVFENCEVYRNVKSFCCVLFSTPQCCSHLLLWYQEARCYQAAAIIKLNSGCQETTVFDVLTGRITKNRACITVVYIGDVWDDPGVWLWNTAGGLSVSCLSHLPRECQTIYLTRYSLSLSLCHTLPCTQRSRNTHTHLNTHPLIDTQSRNHL